MPTISSSQLRPRLAEALRPAESGERVVITRHGKPATALIGAEQLARLERLTADEAPAEGVAPAGDDAAAIGVQTPEKLLERAATTPWRLRRRCGCTRTRRARAPALAALLAAG